MKVIDMHCDTIDRLLRLQDGGRPEGLRQNGGHVDLLRMKESRYLLQNFALFVEMDGKIDPWERVCSLYECYKKELERNRDILAPVLSFSDIAKNEAAGKMSAMLTVEEGGVCKGELAKLHKLYDMGVRMLTLTWNFENEIGSPNFSAVLREPLNRAMAEWKAYEEGIACGTGNVQEKSCVARSMEWMEKQRRVQTAFDTYYHTPNVERGLTERGREFVAEMERLGMIPDVSHLSDAGFYDVCEITKKPFVASHSNARAVSPCVRNLTDDMLRKLSERGGVAGLNFCADFLEETPVGEPNPGNIAALVRHAKHMANVGGIEVLGLGSDFDGIPTHEELPGAECMGRLWEALHRGGFSERELDKIFYENVLRVYRDTLR